MNYMKLLQWGLPWRQSAHGTAEVLSGHFFATEIPVTKFCNNMWKPKHANSASNQADALVVVSLLAALSTSPVNYIPENETRDSSLPFFFST